MRKSACAVWLASGVVLAITISAATAETGLIARTATPLPPAKEGYAYPDCYCTDSNGDRVEIGEYACLHINRREVTAVCGMSLNNPAWRLQDEGCSIS